MSSHHVVREKQEPALLILEYQQQDLPLLYQLLEWSPTVLANESVALQLLNESIKMDVVSCSSQSSFSYQDHVLSLYVPGRRDEEILLDHLLAQSYPAVYILDHGAFPLALFHTYAHRINMTLIRYPWKIYPVRSGFNKWKQKGEDLCLFSPTHSLSTVGLQEKSHLHYQTSGDGFFSLHFMEDMLLLGEKL